PAPESVRYSPAGFDVVALQLFEQPIDRRAVRSAEDRSSPVLGGALAEVVVYHPLVGVAVQRLGLGLPLRPRRLFGRRCEGKGTRLAVRGGITMRISMRISMRIPCRSCGLVRRQLRVSPS